MDETAARTRAETARVGRLATITTAGTPHVVPCCFALHRDVVFTAVDAKPKSTLALRRIENIEANPAASLLIDHFAEDWARLWWVRIDARGRVVPAGAERRRALDLLASKYEQYRAVRPPGPVLALDIVAWRSWEATASETSGIPETSGRSETSGTSETPGASETFGAHEGDVTLGPLADADLAALYALFEAVVESGEGFPHSAPLTAAAFDATWVAPLTAVIAAKRHGVLVGAYYLKPNFVGKASHIANAGYVVAPSERRRGVGRALIEDSLRRAPQLGFSAIQFNLVFSSNPARGLYERFGWQVIGRVPDAVDGEPAIIYWRRVG